MKNIHKITLSIGLKDGKLKKQLHFTRWYYKRIFKAFEFLKIGGATITQGTGYYTHNDGAKIIEKSLIIDFYGENVITIKMLAKKLLKEFNQESIILTIEYTDGEKAVDFIENL